MSYNPVIRLSDPGVFVDAAEHLSSMDERLSLVINKLGVLELNLNRDLFFSLVESILSQQLSPKAADSIIGRFVSLFPGRKVEPEKLLETDEDAIRSCGISRQKIAYVRNVAEGVLDGSLNADDFERMGDADIINRLVRIKGIGTWTAKMFLIFSMGRPDILPHEDLGVVNSVKRVYMLDEKPGKDIIEKIAEKWHPYCSVASLYLWRLKDQLPLEKVY